MCWGPEVVWVAVPGSAHYQVPLSPFSDNDLHTISLSFYVNKKFSHLSCAQDIGCLKRNIANKVFITLQTSVRVVFSCLYSLMTEYVFPQPPITISNPLQPSQKEKRTFMIFPRAPKIIIKLLWSQWLTFKCQPTWSCWPIVVIIVITILSKTVTT